MKTTIKLFFIVILCLAVSMCVNIKPEQLTVIGMAGGDTVLVNVGQSFSASFNIKDAKNVYAIAALVQYDTSFLAVQKNVDNTIATKGVFLGGTGDLTAAFVNNVPGAAVFAYSKQGQQPGSDGEGELWRMTLSARKAGLTKVFFDLSRCSVVSPNIIGNSLEILPSKFENKFFKIAPLPNGKDTAIVYIKIN